MDKNLRNTMERHAHTMDDSRLDLLAVMAQGERRVRRRRWTAGIAVAAVAGAVAFAAPLGWNALGGEGADDSQALVAGQETAGIVWASGSTIHAGDTSVDVGHEVHAFVATTGGYVFVDPDGAVWSWDGNEVRREGATHVTDYETQLLVSDGATAAWLDARAEKYVAVELAADGTEVWEVPADVPPINRPARNNDDETSVNEKEATPGRGGFEEVESGVRALVDGDLVAVDARGIIRIDLGSGEVQTISVDPLSMEINDGEGDQLLVTTYEDGSRREATYLTDDVADLGKPLPVRGGDISPGGAWVMSENSARSSDDFTVVDVATGETREPAAKERYDFFTGFAWTDGDHYVAIGMDQRKGRGADEADEEWTIEFLECAVGGTCEKAPQELSSDGFQLPIGLHIGS